MRTDKTTGNGKRILLAVLFGLLFGAGTTTGHVLEQNDCLVPLSGMLVLRFLLTTVFASAFAYGFFLLPRRAVTDSDAGTAVAGLGSGTPFTIPAFLTLLACNLVVLLGVYPGFFVYDAFDELNEVLTRQFSTHHPLLHVLLMGGSITALHKIGASWNAAIFTYLLAQAAAICAVFTGCLSFIKKRGAPDALTIGSLLYYGLFPTVVMYTLCSSKDGLFSACFLVFTIQLFKWIDDPDQAKDRRFIILYTVSAAGMMLFRHNALYAYAVFAVLVLIPSLRKPSPARRAALLLAPLILALIVSKALTAALHADDSENQEMLTVPIMQLARTYSYMPDTFTEEEKEKLTSYLPEEALARYTPRLADGVKIDFDNAAYEADKAGFWSLWLKKAAAHPVSFLNAWLLTSYGYYTPEAVINVYKGNTVFTFTYTESSYFGYETELPGERKSFFPVIDNLYRRLSLERFQQDVPLVRLLFSPGFLFWVHLLICAGFLSSDDPARRRRALIFLPVFLYWATLLLGPTYLVRYIVILWTLLPLILHMYFFDNI